MKKIILLFIAAFFSQISVGQNIFIGKTISDVKEAYYTAKKENFFQGKNKETKESFFIIKVMGVDKFRGSFDKAGKCFEHSTEISYKDIPLVKSNIKKIGWAYDEKEEKFLNPTKTIYFQVVKEDQLYYLICKKIKK
jgi:hypothetical protein